MREPAFLRQNKDYWLEYEQYLRSGGQSAIDPDRLAWLYARLIDDLAYARTFYPDSQTVRYLNGLAARTHLEIYRNKQQSRDRIITFWAEELPDLFYQKRRFLYYSLVLFLAACLIGVISSLKEPDFTRRILGDSYVEMTLHNIAEGNPTAVYDDDEPFLMFLYIALNNIRVLFLTFGGGILLGLGTMFIVIKNGVMVGTFFTLFEMENVAAQAWPMIMIHGTLELSMIVIAGAAGLILGHGILFPGTYSRGYSLRKAARTGMKISVGLVPVITLAAFFESFLTRYSNMPAIFKFLILVGSLAFVVWYFFLFPISRARKHPPEVDEKWLKAIEF